MRQSIKALFLASSLFLNSSAGQAQSGAATSAAQRPIEPDGTVHVPPFVLPPSPYLSLEAAASLPRSLVEFGGIDGMIKSGRVPQIRAARAKGAEKQFDALKAKYGVAIQSGELGGIRGFWIKPAEVSGKSGAVLIFLPGGAFVLADPGSGVVEALPFVAASKIDTFVGDYRQAPEARFPAASEDVAAIYRALLKTYKPDKIGIFGSSAGGLLTAQSVVWFQRQNLPVPGAAGILCASADARWAGDSWYWHKAFGGSKSPPELMEKAYYGAASLTDPPMSPIESDAVLAKFPPTLLLSSMRAGEVSSTVDTHRRLVRNKVDAELHVWDGLNHCFFNDVNLPESREATSAVARFFRTKLKMGDRNGR